MKKFFIYKKQKSIGCDYTIGCGEFLIESKLKSLDSITEDIEAEIEDYDDPETFLDDLNDLEEYKILVVTEIFDCKKHLKNFAAVLVSENEKKEAAKREEEERAQYLKLKSKFEKT